MAAALAVAGRSRCVRSQVGCVVVDRSGRVVATGYNGPPAGWRPAGIALADELPEPMRCDSFCPRALDEQAQTVTYERCVAIHAELNALLVSDRRHREG